MSYKCEVCGFEFKWRSIFLAVLLGTISCGNCGADYVPTRKTGNIAAFTKPLPILLGGYLFRNTDLNGTAIILVYLITTCLIIAIGTVYIKFTKVEA